MKKSRGDLGAVVRRAQRHAIGLGRGVLELDGSLGSVGSVRRRLGIGVRFRHLPGRAVGPAIVAWGLFDEGAGVHPSSHDECFSNDGFVVQ